MNIDWEVLQPIFWQSLWETLQMVVVTLVVGGFFGLVIGVLLYTTRGGGILANRWVYTVLNVLVNFVRPIPFIIFIVAIGPLTLGVIGTTIGTKAAIFALIIAASFGGSSNRTWWRWIPAWWRPPRQWAPARCGSSPGCCCPRRSDR